MTISRRPFQLVSMYFNRYNSDSRYNLQPLHHTMLPDLIQPMEGRVLNVQLSQDC